MPVNRKCNHSVNARPATGIILPNFSGRVLVHILYFNAFLMPRSATRIFFSLMVVSLFTVHSMAQDTAFYAKHAAILFPYPMYREKWRSSLGLTLVTTPQDITEEVRLRIPCGDFRVLRRVTDNLVFDNRIMFQFLQNHLSTGLYFVAPVSKKFYFSVGNDIGYWFGFLKVSGFDSQASGWMDYPGISVGYKTRNNLLVALKAQVCFNLYYQAANGESKIHSGTAYYNGELFSLSLEQPFYRKKHLALAFSTINNYFYWQTWSLFYKTNRKIFYPQITIALIL